MPWNFKQNKGHWTGHEISLNIFQFFQEEDAEEADESLDNTLTTSEEPDNGEMEVDVR